MTTTKQPCDWCLEIVEGVHSIGDFTVCRRCERQLQRELDTWEREALVEREAERTAEELGMPYTRWYRADDHKNDGDD